MRNMRCCSVQEIVPVNTLTDRQSARRRSAKLVPTFADRGVSRGQRNGSPRPLISVFWTGIVRSRTKATEFSLV